MRSKLWNWIKPQRARPKRRPFTVIQVEVTSRCFLQCSFCPTSLLDSKWIRGDLSFDLYRDSIAPHLGLFDLVYLQGWGEPLNHPHFWEMVALAQEKGCKTGFTTNGAFLKSAQIEKVFDAGVELLSVSFAGATPLVHESLRIGSDWENLKRRVEHIAELKHQGGYQNPWLELHFLMTRSNIHDLPDFVSLAAVLGADEVVATNLTYTPTLRLEQEKVFTGPAAPSQETDHATIEQAKKAARRADIQLRVYPLTMEPHTLVCDADPLASLFVNHRGEAAPCVYMGLSVEGQIPRFFQGQPHPFDPLSYGNVADGLDAILVDPRRKEFIRAFEQRSVIKDPWQTFTFLAAGVAESELLPPPVPCQFCYKMYGV